MPEKALDRMEPEFQMAVNLSKPLVLCVYGNGVCTAQSVWGLEDAGRAWILSLLQ